MFPIALAMEQLSVVDRDVFRGVAPLILLRGSENVLPVIDKWEIPNFAARSPFPSRPPRSMQNSMLSGA